MKKELVLITREFPYGLNETFLESEIIYLCQKFDSVIIFPTVKYENIRSLPNNAIVDNFIADFQTKKMRLIFNTFFSSFFFSTIIKYFTKLSSFTKFYHLVKYTLSFHLYKQGAKYIFSQYSNSIIYSYWYSPVIDSLLSLNNNNNTIVSRVHRGDLYEKFSPLGFFPYRPENISRIHKIYSISEDGKRYLDNHYNVNNVTIARLGVIDNNCINVFNSQTFVVVSVSNVIKVKNVALIAHSIFSFAKLNPNLNISWIHFGEGIELKNIKSYIALNKLSNLHCEFKGRVSNSLIYKFYSSHPVNVIINLSISEGIPVSMMEAISFGIPIIATNVGGVSEIVNNTNGILLSSNPDIDSVVNAFNQILLFPKNRLEIRQDWSLKYSANVNYNHFANDLLNLLK